LPIGGELKVAFDGKTEGDRRPRRREGVLDDPVRAVVQAAMSDRPGDDPVWSAHRTSNIPSTSTHTPKGSSATPTVDRAWRPLSPRTSTMRSEAPFMTAARLTKPGTALMKPPSRTQ